MAVNTLTGRFYDSSHGRQVAAPIGVWLSGVMRTIEGGRLYGCVGVVAAWSGFKR